jgi:ERCC4-type nuclease
MRVASDPVALPHPLIPGVVHVDSRTGSRELAPLLQRNHGLKVKLEILPSADFAFTCGHTAPSPYCQGNYGCRLGFERKTLSDLVGSLLGNRLGGRQLPLMLGPQGYTFSWVVVEGAWRPAPDGAIEVPRGGGQWVAARGGLTYAALQGWLTRYEVLGNGRLFRERTLSMSETAAFIAAKAQWWRKEWKKHAINGAVDKLVQPNRALLFLPNEFHKQAAALPGIGPDNMRKVTKHFHSILEMMLASPKQWREAGVNKVVSQRLYELIRKEWW